MSSIPNSVRVAGLILIALVVYFTARSVLRSTSATTDTAEIVNANDADDVLPEVIVQPAISSPRQISVSLKGRTEPDREVTVRSETIGTVVDASVKEGQFVSRGTKLCGLDIESRAARIAEAEASVRSARLEYDASSELEQKGWTTSNRAAANKATLDRAEAALEAANIELRKTRIVAPFAGVFELRMAERGDFLAIGDPCGRLVDLDPIVAVVEATESQLGAIDPDMPVKVQLATGETTEGTIRYVAKTANEQTRTFRVEVEIDNPGARIAAGLTASVDLNMGETSAVLLTPAALVLHDDGRVGVRYVDGDDVIQFTEVVIADDAAEGVWVTGIPDGVNLLAAGQDYLREGVKVAIKPSQEL
ncbi:MAG: efflux RND transporter periplasmic adaptor subunit [Henriciella sp.]|nr:efflux RND transporter periplasmic adaptor subunit [Henriciella sp.]